jgi:hypothetical protein
MNLNRNRVLAGLAATGIVAGVFAGGGTAVASTGPAHAPSATATTPAPSSSKCAWGHHHGKWHKNGEVAKAVASYLGLSEAQVRSRLESGKSLADVAREQKKPVSGLETTILAAVTKQINASSMTAAEKTKAISNVKSHLGDIVNATCKTPMPSHS